METLLKRIQVVRESLTQRLAAFTLVEFRFGVCQFIIIAAAMLLLLRLSIALLSGRSGQRPKYKVKLELFFIFFYFIVWSFKLNCIFVVVIYSDYSDHYLFAIFVD